MPPRRRGGAGIARVQKLAEERIEQGAEGAYEALQLYLGQCSRRLGKGGMTDGSAPGHAEARAIAAAGASQLYEKGYADCATQLANHLIELYQKGKVPVTQETVDVIAKVAEQVPRGKSRMAFCKKAAAWSQEMSQRLRGEPALHALYAEALLQGGQVERAFDRLVLAERPQILAKIMFDLQEKGIISAAAVELLATKCTLRFLAAENVRDAILFQNMVLVHLQARAMAANDGNPPPGPLFSPTSLHSFCRYITATCQRDAAPLFKELCERYRAQISSHPTFPEFLAEIGARFYGIKGTPQQGMMMNPMMQNMMQMFMQGQG